MKIESNSPKSKISEIIFSWGIGISIIASLAFVIFGFMAWHWGSRTLHHQENPSLSDWGSYGSYLQGAVGSLWSLAGTLLIFAAFLAQKQQLKRQETELEEQAKQFQMQHESIKLQNFENSFFQLLSLHNQNVAQMRISVEQHCSEPNEYDGRECFEKLHNLLHVYYGSRTAEQSADIKNAAEFYSRMFEEYQASLGHYFRTLYHVIKFG